MEKAGSPRSAPRARACGTYGRRGQRRPWWKMSSCCACLCFSVPTPLRSRSAGAPRCVSTRSAGQRWGSTSRSSPPYWCD